MTYSHDSSALLEARNLTVTYAGNTALVIQDLCVGTGEIVGVVGANGAGKSTLVNALAGWSRGTPTITGDIQLNGTAIHEWHTHDRVQAGLLLVPEGRLIFSSMSVEENLTMSFTPTSDHGRKAYSRDEIYSLFPRLKERRNHLGSQLSGGERQMLGIGRALMLGPQLLMLDEPSIGLAPKLVSLVLETLRDLACNGLSILLVEQNVRAAIEVVDRLILLERGKAILEGPAADMRNDPRIAQAYLGVQA